MCIMLYYSIDLKIEAYITIDDRSINSFIGIHLYRNGEPRIAHDVKRFFFFFFPHTLYSLPTFINSSIGSNWSPAQISAAMTR